MCTCAYTVGVMGRRVCLHMNVLVGGHSPLALMPLYACVSLNVFVFLALHICPCEHV